MEEKRVLVTNPPHSPTTPTQAEAREGGVGGAGGDLAMAALAAAAALDDLAGVESAATNLLTFQRCSSENPSPAPSFVPSQRPSSSGEPYRQPWAQEEDAVLRRSVAQNGARQWTLAAAALPGRSAKQCRERWVGALDPSIVQTPFSEEEDELVVTAYRLLGSRWAEMAKMLTGRTDNAVKNRANSGLRALLHPNVRAPTPGRGGCAPPGKHGAGAVGRAPPSSTWLALPADIAIPPPIAPL